MTVNDEDRRRRELLMIQEILDPVADKLLRQPSQPIKTIDGVVREVAEFLEHQMTIQYGGLTPAGWAAVQFGEPIRLIIFQWDTMTNRVLINPEVVSEKDSVTKIEKCFSIPDHAFIVARPKMVKCRGLDLNGNPVTIKGRDKMARLLKHEIDHLDGILIDQITERRLY